MKDIFESLFAVLIALFMLSMCKGCSDSYQKGGDNKAISNYQKMIFDNSQTTAEYYPEYKETTIKIMKIPAKMYEFRYFFTVNNSKFEGQRTLFKLPESNVFKVFYLKEDPNFNSAVPNEDMENEKKKNSSKSDLYWAIGWGIFGVLILIGAISTIVDNMKKRA